MTPGPNTVSSRGPHNRVRNFAAFPAGGRNGRVYYENSYQHQEKNYVNNQYQQQGSNNSKRSTVENSNGKDKKREYFAGAKFDCLPSVSSLPTPPAEWTIPVMRSQSQPSSPVNSTVRIDVGSLFHTPQVVKSSSYAGRTNEDMETIFIKKYEQEEKAKLNGNSISGKTAEIETSEKQRRGGNRRRRENEPVTTTSSARKELSFQSNKTVMEQGRKKPEPTKPVDILRSTSGCGGQAKSMYPDLTEHLRGLLKVQG